MRDAIRARCRANLGVARGGPSRERPAVELLEPGGGWSAVLRFPRVVAEEALVLELLERHGVAVHPGYFFDFATEGYLVLSLLAGTRRTFDADVRTQALGVSRLRTLSNERHRRTAELSR